jgi:fusaric acid resistance family protein
MLILLIPASEHGLQLAVIDRGLEVVALVALIDVVAMFFWNYAFYAAALTTAILILADVQRPSDYATEGYRVAWTLCGVGIAVIVMLLAGLLARRTAKAPPQQAAQPA